MESPRPELFASEALLRSREQSGLRRRRIVIVGAAGRDFHNFNMVYRDDPTVEVVAFTAAQIADIDGRRYPPSLAGRLYPGGIPILKNEQISIAGIPVTDQVVKGALPAKGLCELVG